MCVTKQKKIFFSALSLLVYISVTFVLKNSLSFLFIPLLSFPHTPLSLSLSFIHSISYTHLYTLVHHYTPLFQHILTHFTTFPLPVQSASPPRPRGDARPAGGRPRRLCDGRLHRQRIGCGGWMIE